MVAVLVEDGERRDRADRPDLVDAVLLVTQLALGAASFPRSGEAAQVLGATERPEGAPCAARRKRPPEAGADPEAGPQGPTAGWSDPTCRGALHRAGWSA